MTGVPIEAIVQNLRDLSQISGSSDGSMSENSHPDDSSDWLGPRSAVRGLLVRGPALEMFDLTVPLDLLHAMKLQLDNTVRASATTNHGVAELARVQETGMMATSTS